MEKNTPLDDRFHTKKVYEHQTPRAPRMTQVKRDLLSKGLPHKTDYGVVDVNERGDLIVTYNDGQTGLFVNHTD